MSFRLCPSCSRHVREDQCPFCGGDVASNPVAAEGAMPRVARIALFGAAAAALATACGTTSPQPLYGAVIPDASVDAPGDAANDAASDAGQDATTTFYGGPPIDSGTD